MSMSKDRVKFAIPVCRLTTSSQASEYRRVCAEVFGDAFLEKFDRLKSLQDIIVICRPSQFARFLIKRNQRGVQNNFSELNPFLFTPKAETTTTIDVSELPARIC